jgi:hypothetical protein
MLRTGEEDGKHLLQSHQRLIITSPSAEFGSRSVGLGERACDSDDVILGIAFRNYGESLVARSIFPTKPRS